MALRCGEPAPEHGGEQVAADLFAGEVLRVVGLQLGLGLFQPVFEVIELPRVDAACADAYSGGLSGHMAAVGCDAPQIFIDISFMKYFRKKYR